MEGFPGLATSYDLFEKLQNDYELLKKDKFDPYKAYNFFVTAEHLPDWVNNKSLKWNNPYLRICSHIATGAKHFHVTHKDKDSVESYSIDVYVKDGYVEGDYVMNYMMVELSDKEREALGVNAIEISALAEEVLRYWDEYFINNPIE